MLFSTSADILNIVIAVCVAVLTVCIAWILIESARTLHTVNRAIKELQEKFAKVEAALCGIRDKLEHSVGHLGLIAAGAKQIIEMFLNRKGDKKKKKV